MSYDFQLEAKLIEQAPQLHTVFSDNVLCVQNMLIKYQSIFPNYTDHTALHSLEVIAFCNELIADNIDLLNTDEIFILLMSAYLHDAGMGISIEDFERFSAELPIVQDFMKENPDICKDEIIRAFHNEFSGRFIEKYSPLFDFPSPEHLFAIVQTSRGHRKTDLLNKTEYPAEIKLSNGNIVHLPYLATLIRLADELDIAVDRNIQFLYDTANLDNDVSRLEFKKHQAIKRLEILPTSLKAYVDYSDPELVAPLDELFEKLNSTLSYCVRVIEEITPFSIAQKTVEIEKL